MVELTVRVPVRSDISVDVYAGGAINISNITGALELSTHRAAINAIDIDGPIVAESWGQDIVVIFSKYDNEYPSSMTSHQGNIDITIPEKSTKATLYAQSYQGEILSGLDAEFIPSDEIKKTTGKGQRVSVGGGMMAKLNGGEQKMSAQTFSGNIYIRKK